MKKITFLTLFCLAALGVHAQNFYNFTKSQAEYVDLENSTSINNGEVWVYDTYDPVTIPFNFSLAGQTINKFYFEDDYFAFTTPDFDVEENTGIFFMSTSSAIIEDRTFSTNISSSPISYKVEGEPGNRIMKLEVKNAGLENAENLGFSEDHFYLNFQIWLYENNNVVEIRYGENNITDPAYIEDDIIAGIVEDELKAYYAYGDSANPSYGEFTEATFPDGTHLNTYPANGTVYRFTPSSVAGLPQFASTTTKLYPNPASSVINLKSDNVMVSEYAIYNILGKLVAESKITESNNAQINIDSLEKGIYFVKANNQYLKFIKN